MLSITRTRMKMAVVALFLTASCGSQEVGQLPATEPESGVPEIGLELAADGQDLSTVRLLPDDGCYWYEHRGQVETTLLPLRARNGAAICRQAQA